MDPEAKKFKVIFFSCMYCNWENKMKEKWPCDTLTSDSIVCY